MAEKYYRHEAYYRDEDNGMVAVITDVKNSEIEFRMADMIAGSPYIPEGTRFQTLPTVKFAQKYPNRVEFA